MKVNFVIYIVNLNKTSDPEKGNVFYHNEYYIILTVILYVKK